ncbi:MAG: DUF6785 family protein [Acidimicrobiales bacterium]
MTKRQQSFRAAIFFANSVIASKTLADERTSCRDARRSRRESGVTPRVVALCLALAVVFGYALPVIDYKLSNTFLGAAHLPPGAIGVLLALVLVVNPLLRFFGKSLSRNEALTVYITCLFSSLVPGHGSENFLIPNPDHAVLFRDAGKQMARFVAAASQTLAGSGSTAVVEIN